MASIHHPAKEEMKTVRLDPQMLPPRRTGYRPSPRRLERPQLNPRLTGRLRRLPPSARPPREEPTTKAPLRNSSLKKKSQTSMRLSRVIITGEMMNSLCALRTILSCRRLLLTRRLRRPFSRSSATPEHQSSMRTKRLETRSRKKESPLHMRLFAFTERTQALHMARSEIRFDEVSEEFFLFFLIHCHAFILLVLYFFPHRLVLTWSMALDMVDNSREKKTILKQRGYIPFLTLRLENKLNTHQIRLRGYVRQISQAKRTEIWN